MDCTKPDAPEINVSIESRTKSEVGPHHSLNGAFEKGVCGESEVGHG
jgi:hypothetical protein